METLRGFRLSLTASGASCILRERVGRNGGMTVLKANVLPSTRESSLSDHPPVFGQEAPNPGVRPGRLFAPVLLINSEPQVKTQRLSIMAC